MSLFVKQTIINGILLIVMVVAVTLSISRVLENNQETYYNKARVLLASELAKATAGEDLEDTYQYYKMDLSGTVTASINSSYELGDKLNIQEALQIDHNYYEKNESTVKVTFPILSKGIVTSFIVFSIDESVIRDMSTSNYILYLFGPVLVGIIICLLVCFFRSIYLGSNILRPMNEMVFSSHAIINGNYDVAMISTKSNKLRSSQIDELTYGFELMRDELENKELREAKMKRSQKEMISCISHDLKTPISTIRAYAEAMKDGLANDKDKQVKYIATIITKTEILTKMMNDLLDHSNAELNELSIIKKEEYLGDFFDILVKELEIHVTQNGCKFSWSLDVPNIIGVFDKGRITQVIYNLVENAMKYMDKDIKEVRFAAKYVKEEKSVSITIEDNGPGISITDIPYVFERFYRAEKSRSTSIPGSGLGLSICKYIVENHDGEISLKSKTEEGSTFTFYIRVN